MRGRGGRGWASGFGLEVLTFHGLGFGAFEFRALGFYGDFESTQPVFPARTEWG